METRSLQYDLTGKDQMAVQLRKLRQFYYGEMQDVRRLVFDESSKVFEPPLASLLASSGHIDRLKVSLRSTGGVPQTIALHNGRLTVFDVLETGAMPQTIELHNVPSPEYAVISAARDTDAAIHFIADLTGRLRGRLRGAPADDDEKFELRPMDVGLGVPTFGFGPLGSTSTSSDGREEGWRIEAEGDVLPHYFAHDRFVVVSSSVRLSKAILAAGRGEANRIKLPRVDSGELIAYGRSPASLFARLVEQVGSWSAALADEKKATIEGDLFENLRPKHESSRALSRFLVGLAEIIRLVDGAEWRTSQSAQGRTSRIVISPRE